MATKTKTEVRKNTRNGQRTYRLFTEQKDGNLRPLDSGPGRSPQEALRLLVESGSIVERTIKGKKIIGIAEGNIKNLSE